MSTESFYMFSDVSVLHLYYQKLTEFVTETNNVWKIALTRSFSFFTYIRKWITHYKLSKMDKGDCLDII